MGPRLFVVAARGKATSAGGVVLDRRGRVALVRQPDRDGDLRWTLPKGRVDPGETLEEAALREVLEESGVHARITAYIGVHEGKRSFIHYFRMVMTRVAGEPDPRETVAMRFVPLARARELVRSARDRQVLALAVYDDARALRRDAARHRRLARRLRPAR